MADTIIGIPTQGASPEWSQFDFAFDQEYLNAGLGFESAESFPHYQQRSYETYNSDIQPTLPNPANHAFPPDAFMKAPLNNNPSESGSNTHLSQEQMAALEASFQEAPKPKMESRKSLARMLGLELQRVNHWYQNRRQKAKSRRHSGRPGSDSTSNSAPPANISMPLAMSPSETPISTSAFLDQQPVQDAELSSPKFNIDSACSYSQMLHQQARLSSCATGTSLRSTSNDGQPSAFPQASGGNFEWPSDLESISFNDPLAGSGGPHQGSSPMTAKALTASQTFPIQPSPLSYKASESWLLSKESTQTLNSNPSSSFGDSNSLMTPPNPTPPPSMPWLSSEFDTRRTSDSSELAHTVEGMHLQQRPRTLGVVTTSLEPVSHSSLVSMSGIATPDSSPEQAAGRPYAPHSDLASRRKRVRPAALRPDNSRSISYNDPLSRSPHSRNSLVGVAVPVPPRRTQSSGQVLHNQFRVHKQSSNPAQISPRNLQTHVDRHAPPQKRSATNSASASPTTSQHATNRPSASAASANRSPAEYQHEFHVRSTSSNHGCGGAFQMPRHANSSVPNLHCRTVQAHGPLSNHLPGEQNPQLLSYHGPPQSAPPHQSTFFDDSWTNKNGPFLPPGVHAHTHTLGSGPNEISFSSAPGQQTGHYVPQGQAGYLPPFAPHYTFPDSSHMTGFAPHGFLAGYPPGSFGLAPAPAVELDIKVELGPQPKLSQRFEKCEFNHTFSNKWGQTSDKDGDKK